jgi:hypothetical protein
MIRTRRRRALLFVAMLCIFLSWSSNKRCINNRVSFPRFISNNMVSRPNALPQKVIFVNCINGDRARRASPSRAERIVGKVLDRMGLYYFYDAQINNFVGRSGSRHLRFDFIVVAKQPTHTHTDAWKIQFVIECQGAFHYRVVPGMNSHKQLREQQINDDLKRAYCCGANIPLLEIPFWVRPESHIQAFVASQQQLTPAQRSRR